MKRICTLMILIISMNSNAMDQVKEPFSQEQEQGHEGYEGYPKLNEESAEESPSDIPGALWNLLVQCKKYATETKQEAADLCYGLYEGEIRLSIAASLFSKKPTPKKAVQRYES